MPSTVATALPGTSSPPHPTAAAATTKKAHRAPMLRRVGFMEALHQYRLRCPEDVALVTCDDYPWMDSFSPRLTTIDLPKRELGAAAAQLLVERGADLGVRVTLPGHYEKPDEVIECTPLGYALRFQKESHSEGRTIAFLRERGAVE